MATTIDDWLDAEVELTPEQRAFADAWFLHAPEWMTTEMEMIGPDPMMSGDF